VQVRVIQSSACFAKKPRVQQHKHEHDRAQSGLIMFKGIVASPLTKQSLRLFDTLLARVV
jgi:hypothetical protein